MISHPDTSSTKPIIYEDFSIILQATIGISAEKNFYKNEAFISTICKAFYFKNPKIVKEMLKNWEKAIDEEVEWWKEIYAISEDDVLTPLLHHLDEVFQIEKLHLREMVKLLNISILTKKWNLSAEVGLAFALGIIYATFIFEGTCMCLTIKQIYDIIPEKQQRKMSLKRFKKLFFLKGTSDEINKILYNIKNMPI